MQKTLPLKVKDPRNFTISCTIGNCEIGKTLVDLGANINLMPLSVLKKIGGLQVKYTIMILQMVDKSTKNPYGVMEDVVAQIDKLKFLVDFVVMEIGEDVEIPLILGKPFMKTTKVVINVDEGMLTLKDQDEEVTFNVFNDVQPIQGKQTSLKITYEVLPESSI
ncbi:uncharacterized protein LOC106773117 [Vigna radiata var. radiata]|uniref:Uncharacterized protein LOC106773117 n=1 Tax=Vigna radiata var. radiata TaxID=3916 RepID=A0A1S3VAB3_VIGRR|nr:uncharacterized protein LOC106773117 [Vigna radiata var. radiata]